MQITIVSPKHDLERLVKEINCAAWDEANEMSEYDRDSLLAYLNRQDTLFITCLEVNESNRTLLGMASSRIEIKPYGKELWLYVDEVDVCADQRQKGVGKKIMQYLIDYAEVKGCEEVWLGTELDNHPANALYKSLDPDDVSDIVGYTYEMD